MKGKKKIKTGFPPVDGKLEWVCAEVPAMLLPGSQGIKMPLRIWMELPTDVILSSDAPGPDTPLPPIEESLRKAAWQPIEGSPRLPGAIRVADATTATQLRRIDGLKCEVRQAPTPEAESFLEAFAQTMAQMDAREDYLQGGRIRPSVVGDFFQTAKALYRLAPWRTLFDSELIRVNIPALRVDDAYLSVIGQNLTSLGFLLFSSFEDYESFADTAIDIDADCDRPLDLNSSWISLEFIPQNQISPQRLAQVKEHGWVVAGRTAYPEASRFDRGEPADIREKDILVLTACARALVPFLSQCAAPGFNLNALEMRSFTGPGGIEVILEPAFDDEDEDEEAPVFSKLQPAPVPVVKVGRNDPCPCGSGKKFKKCCLTMPSSGSSAEAENDVHTMDARLVAQIMDFAFRRYNVSEKAILRQFANPSMNAQLLFPYFAYCTEVKGRRLLDLFLEEKGRNLAQRERKWLSAQLRSWLSVWEIEDVDKGKGMTLVDLLTGERRTVVEKLGSSQALRRMAILARIVDFENLSVVCGSHSLPMPPMEAAGTVDKIREQLRFRKFAPIESLQNYEASRTMLAVWEQAASDLEASTRRRPKLQNTDGHPLIQTIDRFAFAPADVSEIESRLSRMENVRAPEPDETVREFIFSRTNPPTSPMSSVTIGTVRIEQNTLVAETNSVQRADDLRARIEKACGSLLKPSLREHVDVMSAAARTSSAGSAETEEEQVLPPEISGPIVRQFKEELYARWLDQSIPALKGKTPREAVKTPHGRSQVEALLKQIEYIEAQSTQNDSFDVSTLRAQLGMNSDSGS